MLRFLICALFLGLLADHVSAHGSVYRGPSSGELPPGMRAPSDPQPPGEPPPASPTGLAWDFWWSLNKEEFLYPGSDSPAREPLSEPPVNAGTLRREIIGSMSDAVIAKLGCPGRSRVALALGAMGAGQGGLPAATLRRLAAMMKNRSLQTIVQTASALALGMSQDPDPFVADSLCDTLADEKAHAAVRGSAALALGLLRSGSPSTGHRRVVKTLANALQEVESGNLGACVLLAAGLSGDPELLSGLEAVLARELTGKGPSLDDRTLARAVSGLGKLAETVPGIASRTRLDLVTEALRRGAKLTKRSAVIALGQLGADPEILRKSAERALDALAATVGGTDLGLRKLALLSLGRIGRVCPDRELRSRIIGELISAARSGDPALRPFAALALGIAGRSAHLTKEDRRPIVDALRAGIDPTASPSPSDATNVPCVDSPSPTPPAAQAPPLPTPLTPPPPDPALAPDPTEVGAFAIALGLIGDQDSSEALLATVRDEALNGRVRGFAAVALGMLGIQAVVDELRPAFETSTDSDLVVLGAIGASILEGGDLVPVLVRRLEQPDVSARHHALLTRALGKLADRRAVAPLLRVLVDEKASGTARSIAAIALADLHDRDGGLVLTRLTRNLDYEGRSATVSLIFKLF